jgi:hypothetical protein
MNVSPSLAVSVAETIGSGREGREFVNRPDRPNSWLVGKRDGRSRRESDKRPRRGNGSTAGRFFKPPLASQFRLGFAPTAIDKEAERKRDSTLTAAAPQVGARWRLPWAIRKRDLV